MLSAIVLGDIAIPVPSAALLISLLAGGTGLIIRRIRGTATAVPFPVRLFGALVLAVILGTVQLVGATLLTVLAACIQMPYVPVIEVDEHFRTFCGSAWSALRCWVTLVNQLHTAAPEAANPGTRASSAEDRENA